MALYDHLIKPIPGAFGSWLRARRHKQLNAKPPETVVEHLVAWVKTVVWAVSVVTIVNGLALASFTVPTGSMERTVMAGDYVFVNKFIYGPSTPQVIPFINMSMPFYKLPPLSPPAQGDVIVFIFPGNRDQAKADNFEYYLKRCIAVAGDTLHIRGGRTYVNGVEYPLPAEGQFANWPPELRQARYEEDKYLTFPPNRGYTRDDYGPIRIPAKGDVIKLSPANIGEWATFIRREGHLLDEVNISIDGTRVTEYVVERDYVFGMGDNRDNSLDSRYWGFIPEEDVVGTPMIVYWSWQNVDEVSTRAAQMQGYPGQVEYPLTEKIKRVRWSRLGTIIR